ncbi:hypothetical protein NJB18091_29420 [Mycobacterium marinum]|nr:hypothetical protein NJB18091_29420 [Mycobacterium marinum]GJO18787.1 hypothetical protein NJB1507_11040 [Mycobacterium marinum]
MFPGPLAATMTGVTKSQLARWRRQPVILAPEYGTRPRALYSFRDLIALRTFARLRSDVSLQKIRRALSTLDMMDLTEHPSKYQLVAHGDSIALVDKDAAIDLVRAPTTLVMVEMVDVFKSFMNRSEVTVVDFKHPKPRLEVNLNRLGGWPTIKGTRVPYDTIVDLVADGDVTFEEVSEYYPSVTPDDVADAVAFARLIEKAA